MKEKARSTLSWLLSLLMVFTMMPGSAFMSFADSEYAESPTPTAYPALETTYTYGDTASRSLSVAVEPLQGNGTLSYQWYEDTDNQGNDTNNPVEGGNSATLALSGTMSAGDHYFFCIVTNSEEGKQDATYSSTYGKVTVEKKTVGLQWGNTELKYNGQPQAPSVTATGLVGSDTCDVTVTGQETAAGTGYTATASALDNGNYKLPEAKTQAFTISKRNITITANDQSVPYTRNSVNSGSDWVTIGGDGLADGDTVADFPLAVDPAVVTQWVMGEYENAIIRDLQHSMVIANGNSENMNGNYNVTSFVPGNLTLIAAPSATPDISVQPQSIDNLTYGSVSGTLSLTADSEAGELTYQWYRMAPGTVGNSGGTAISGATGSSYAVSSDLGAGTHCYYCVVTNTDGYFSPTSVTSSAATVTVAPLEAQLSWSNDAFTYDGQSHAPDAAVSNLVAGDTCTVTVSGAQTDANTGSEPNYTATATGLSNANYALPAFTMKSFTIAPRTAELEWGNTNLVYNSKAQVPAATVSNLVSGDECHVTVAVMDNNHPVFMWKVGNYTATAINLSNANYKLSDVTADNEKGFAIIRKPLGISPKNQVIASGDDIQTGTDWIEVVGLEDDDAIDFANSGMSITVPEDRPLTGTGTIFVTFDNLTIKDRSDNDVTEYYSVGIGGGKYTVVSTPYTLSGVVYANGGNSDAPADRVEGATVTLEKGGTVYAVDTTNDDGEFSFTTAEPGTYNIVVKKGGSTKTELLKFTEGTAYYIEMPPEKTVSELDNSAAGVFAPVVEGLDELAYVLRQDLTYNGETVAVLFTVTSDTNSGFLTSEEKAEYDEGKAAIGDYTGAAGMNLRYFNLSLAGTHNGTPITNFGSNNDMLLHIIIPFDCKGKIVKMFRCHRFGNLEVTELPELSAPPQNNWDEGFIASDEQIDLYARRFSTYAIGVANAAQPDPAQDPTPGGGSGGGRTSGGIAADQPTVTPETPDVQEPEFTGGNGAIGGFTDVEPGAYYADAVQWAAGKNITNGKSSSLFGPNDSCTRGQTVTFLWRSAGCPEPTDAGRADAAGVKFTDVKPDAYYYKAVLWATEKGITKGTGADTFSPNALVTRAETVTFLYRALGGSGASGVTGANGAADVTGQTGVSSAAGVTGAAAADATGASGTTVAVQNAAATTGAGPVFTDVPAGAYYADAVKWAVAKGITTGTSATTFSPNANCTRGQIVTFLYRVYN